MCFQHEFNNLVATLFLQHLQIFDNSFSFVIKDFFKSHFSFEHLRNIIRYMVFISKEWYALPNSFLLLQVICGSLNGALWQAYHSPSNIGVLVCTYDTNATLLVCNAYAEWCTRFLHGFGHGHPICNFS
jgi:hypothetical protein